MQLRWGDNDRSGNVWDVRIWGEVGLNIGRFFNRFNRKPETLHLLLNLRQNIPQAWWLAAIAYGFTRLMHWGKTFHSMREIVLEIVRYVSEDLKLSTMNPPLNELPQFLHCKECRRVFPKSDLKTGRASTSPEGSFYACAVLKR